MKRRSIFLYLLLGGLIALAALIIYFYQEYLGENPNLSLESGQNSIIAQKVKGVVTQTDVKTVNDQQKLAVSYTNLESNEVAHFTVNAEYEQRIHPGDTVTKDKGEKILLVNQKDGKIEIVPID